MINIAKLARGRVGYQLKALRTQTARSPRPEGVRRCPVACWKATFMYFTKIKKILENSFFFNIFRLAKIFGSKISNIFDFSKNFTDFTDFQKFSEFPSPKFTPIEKKIIFFLFS